MHAPLLRLTLWAWWATSTSVDTMDATGLSVDADDMAVWLRHVEGGALRWGNL